MTLTLDDARTAWQAALKEIQLQMSPATFNTWLKSSRVGSLDGACLVVVVQHAAAVPWLQNRLLPVIQRALDRHTPGLEVRFDALLPPPGDASELGESGASGEPGEPGASGTSTGECPDNLSLQDVLATTIEFIADPGEKGGWHPTARYATLFWQPYLGPVAWSVYNLVRSDDTRTAKLLWTPFFHYEVSYLARLAAPGRTGRGNRSAIVGRWHRRPCPSTGETKTTWSPGAFDRLELAGVAHVRWHNGDGRWRPWQPGGAQECRERARTGHELSVVTWLPYLTPAEVACLPDELQGKHQRYLRDRDFDVDEWRRLALPTLAGLDLNTPELIAALSSVTGALSSDIRAALSFFVQDHVPKGKERRNR